MYELPKLIYLPMLLAYILFYIHMRSKEQQKQQNVQVQESFLTKVGIAAAKFSDNFQNHQ